MNVIRKPTPVAEIPGCELFSGKKSVRRRQRASGAYAACIEAETRQRAAELKTIYGWRLQKFGKAIN
jgi:hypothetical protein